VVFHFDGPRVPATTEAAATHLLNEEVPIASLPSLADEARDYLPLALQVL